MAEADKLATGERMLVQPTDALLVIDLVQETFRPHGDLPVAGGDAVVRIVMDAVLPKFPIAQADATLDVHPKGHVCRVDSYRRFPVGQDPSATGSASVVRADLPAVLTLDVVRDWTEDRLAPHALFTLADLREYLKEVKSQVLWPAHGDPLSRKTWFCYPFDPERFNLVLIKGTDPCDDSYSAVRSNRGRSTGLVNVYRRRGVQRVFLVGLAFDYCVGWTAEDLADAGFEVVVIEDATRAISAAGAEATKRSFAEKGICLVQSDQLVGMPVGSRPLRASHRMNLALGGYGPRKGSGEK